MLFLFSYAQEADSAASESQKKDQTINEIAWYLDQARTYKHNNTLNLALATLDKAQHLSEKNDDDKSLVQAYHQISLVYLELGRRDETEFYHNKASAMLKNMEYPYGNAYHKYISAILQFDKKLNFQALYTLIDAKRLNNDRNLLNNLLLTEGDVLLANEDYEKAIKNYNALIVNQDEKEQDYLASRAYLGLANLNYKTEEWNASIENGEQALKIATANDYFKEILEANELLSKLHEKAGQYGSSLAYNRNILNLKDSVFTIQKARVEAKTADKINSDLQKRQIVNLEGEIDELSKSKNRSEITAILTSAFLTIISLLAVSLYRNNQIKLKTNDLLQTKNNELQTARDAAVKAMEAKTNFLSTVSHELRTPLYAVTGLTHLLLEENPANHQKEHLKSLKFSGDYLLNFINDILQINKIDADKLEPLQIEFNLKKVLTETINTLQQSAKENNTQLTLQYDSRIPTQLMSDPIKLSQVFINLVGNAIKFTKDGEVVVIAKLKKKVDEDVTIYCEVKDTGIGISLDQQENIFDSFEQGSIQINREYGGTGLGLTIVKSLLGLFDSKIELKSEMGRGSSFFFELEMKSKDGTVDDIPFEIAEQDYELAGKHILIVEDNKINQVITKKMLTKRDMTCDIAGNGTKAVALAEENTYDCILMDIHMPGISGEEATVLIREFDKEIPIIALTAISLDDSLESFYAAGCTDVVTKPFKPEVFYQKIGEHIYARESTKVIT